MELNNSVISPRTNDRRIVLTKESSEDELKSYFTAVLNLSRSSEDFPVNLDNVWPLVY